MVDFGKANIAVLQLNPTVGAVEENLLLVAGSYRQAVKKGAGFVITPECVLTGYPPEDLLLLPDFRDAVVEAIQQLTDIVTVPLLLGTPWPLHFGSVMPGDQPHWENSALLIAHRKIIGRYGKRSLPNYGVFDERRWFRAGQLPGLFEIMLSGAPCRLGVTICEDIWDAAIRSSLPTCDLLVNLSASPYSHHKWQQRTVMMSRARQTAQADIGLYCNLAGGQDELVFDGRSFVVRDDGCQQLAGTDQAVVSLADAPKSPTQACGDESFDPELVTAMLTTSIHDYVIKSGFTEVVVGLSGGIDSALVLALAVKALGAEQVLAVSLPSRFSSTDTRSDSQGQAERLGIRFREIPVESLFATSLDALSPLFEDAPWDLTEENLQARLRGVLLMAISNKQNRLLLTTGNKSEYAVGYATLYGDMNGAFAPLKDLYKTEVFAICRWWQDDAGQPMVLPSIVERPPSAELRDGQRDDQSLPPYPVLDRFLRQWIDERRPLDELARDDFSAAEVKRWVRAVRLSEYKRRQAPPGPKLTANAFGRERRLPIVNRFKP